MEIITESLKLASIYPQQAGWNAINLGMIVDVEGFFERLKEGGL